MQYRAQKTDTPLYVLSTVAIVVMSALRAADEADASPQLTSPQRMLVAHACPRFGPIG
jgi:hypothetical protein